MSTAAKALGQRNAVELRARAQTHLGAFVIGMPHQGIAAALACEQVAHLAVEHARAVDHQALLAVEHQHLCAVGDVGTELLEFLVHGTATGHVDGFLLGRERRNFGPALETAHGLHVQSGQKGRAFGELPFPDIAVLDVANQAGHRLVCLEKLPGQARAGFVHVEMDHAALALVAAKLLGRALVVVQHHELGHPRLDLGHQHGLEGKVQHIDGAASQLAQVVGRLNLAVVQAAKLGLTFIEQPGGQRRTKTVGAATTMVEDEGIGIVAIGTHQQLLEQGDFGVLCCHKPVFSPLGPQQGDPQVIAAASDRCLGARRHDGHHMCHELPGYRAR